jgi:RNA polymerase sigma-70 factor (ECF subfamily)
MVALLPRLRRFACALTGSMDEGDDLAQATVERAIRNLDKWQPGTRLDSWMFRIAQNIRLNRIRGMQIRNRHLQAVSTDHHAVSDGVRTAETRLTLAAVRQFVARLPEEQRAVLLLVCVEGLSYREVCETLDLPMGTVTSRLARARIALRAFMQAGEAAPTPLPTRIEA